jgi:hypothetical protein
MVNSQNQQYYQVSLGALRFEERKRKEDMRIMVDDVSMRSIIRLLCRKAGYFPTEQEATEEAES